MSFLNLRIRGRLYGGFGVLLAFCAALAGFAVYQLGGIQDGVASMTIQSKNTIRVVQITAELHAIRRAILRYNFDQDEASYAEAEKRLTGTMDLLDLAIKETRSEERRTVYTDVQKDVAELKLKRVAMGDAIKQLVAGRACCLPTAIRWQRTSRNSSTPRKRPNSPIWEMRWRRKCFWFASRTGNCWPRGTPKA